MYSILSATFLITISCALFVPEVTDAFPIIAEIHTPEPMCFEFNLPDDDEVHMLFVALPHDEVLDEEGDLMEDWYVREISETTRHDSDRFMEEIQLTSDLKSRAKSHSRRPMVNVNIYKPGQNWKYAQDLHYYKPHVVENISKQSGASTNKRWDPNLGGYSVCFTTKKGSAHVVYDFVVVSEYEAKMKKKHVVKKEHLSPLEKSFDESVIAAKSILDEMHYMEKREMRMKKTSDSINTRIRYFSYLSVSILLGVTWIQISYLKGYFKKIKVL